MLSHLAEQIARSTADASRSAAASERATRPTPTEPGISPSSGSKPACRSGGTRLKACRSRSGCSCRTCRTPFTSCTSCVRVRPRPTVDDRARAPPVRELPPAGGAGQRAAGLAVRVSRRRERLRNRAPGSELPPLRLSCARPTRRSPSRASASSTCCIRSKKAGAIRRAATCGARVLPHDARVGEPGTLVASTESVATMLVLEPADGARGRARPARAGFWRRPRPRRATASARSSCWPPISSSSRRPAGKRRTARARAAGDEVRTVIAGYHWFTDWGRDTMISLEGLTLVDRTSRRSGLHPADVRALRARRTDSEHVSRRREGRPVSHRRCDAVVLPRHRRGIWPIRATGSRSRSCIRR